MKAADCCNEQPSEGNQFNTCLSRHTEIITSTNRRINNTVDGQDDDFGRRLAHNNYDTKTLFSNAEDAPTGVDEAKRAAPEAARSEQQPNRQHQTPTSDQPEPARASRRQSRALQLAPTSSYESASRQLAPETPLTQPPGEPPRGGSLRPMELCAASSLGQRLAERRSLPNNTLLADLSECHPTLGRLVAVEAPSWLLRAAGGLLRRRKCHEFQPKTGAKIRFRMPESVAALNLALRPDDYDSALSVLASDVRFQLHLLLYRRVQLIWTILTSILCVLAPVVLTNLELIVLAAASSIWFGLQVIGAFVSDRLRRKLNGMLEKSVAQVNGFFLEHNLMLGVINVGGLISKSKLLVPMLYFDTSSCREQIESIISVDSRKDADGNTDKRILDYSKIGLPPKAAKPNAAALAQSQLAKKIVLRYSQRWISYFDKRKLIFTDDQVEPRHLSTGKCLCQFIEDHFSTSDFCRGDDSRSPASAPDVYSPLEVESAEPDQRLSEEPTVEATRRAAQTSAPSPVPTLSKLVRLRESSAALGRLSIDMSVVESPHEQQVDSRGRRLSSNGYDSAGHSPTSSIRTQSHTYNEQQNASLEIGGDLIGRSDDLVRKLRLLLELRKNELQGLDGSLFSSVLYRVPYEFATSSDVSQPDDEPTAQMADEVAGRQPKTGLGRKFFAQGEGLFFLGANGSKKVRPDTNQSYVLEIC